jgi:hypothetical protein
MTKKNPRHLVVPANTSHFSWRSPRGDAMGSFTPNGRLAPSVPGLGSRALVKNRAAWSSKSPLYSARVVVGFNVDGEPMWEMDDLVALVRRVREEQVGTPDSTFLYQRGLYTSKKRVEGGKPAVEDEDGGQVIIINLPEFGATYKRFHDQMVSLAEVIASEFDQEEVILEIQKGGISKETLGVKST